jgi:hypothetical protein
MIAKDLKEFHKLVCERDKYVCQLQTSPECKHNYNEEVYFNESGVNQYVCGDHLLTQGGSPELRLDTTNGKCVCFPCHVLRHKGNVPEGYIEQVVENVTTTEEFTDEQITQRMLSLSNSIPKREYPLTGIKATYSGKVIEGRGMTLAGIKCKKCKKYNAHGKGLCLACQPFCGHNLKLKKERKNGK